MRTPAEQSAEHHYLGRRSTSGQQPKTPASTSPPQRQGDRSSGDDDAAPRLPVFVRFHDLRAAKIVGNWAQLYNLINDYGFPAGVMLSPNIRAWNIEDVRAWLDTRPSERKKVVAPRHIKEEEAA